MMSDYKNNSKESVYDTNTSSDEDEYNYEEEDEEEDEKEMEIPSKRPRMALNGETNRKQNADSTKHLSIGQKIMGKYGHIEGRGLGKHEQGIVEPVKASEQKGKRGLGFYPEESEYNVEPEEEHIFVEETVQWLTNTYADPLTREILDEWLRIGPPKHTIDDEYHFCNPNVLRDVLDSKSKLDGLGKDLLLKGKNRCNPFETIGKGIFLNRAAMKMANMDRVFDRMFTEPKDQDGNKILGPFDLLYFADVCAGPGGFSEYVFYRKKWKAKGFGFTLKNANDFKLSEFFAGPSETFEAHYGVPIDRDVGDGDVFKQGNIDSFSAFVMENTDGQGVHFMMADGGFSCDEKSIQEVISKQLYLCQCLVALKIVRTKGNFVTKLFDIFTPFSVGLVYLMHRSFDRISILKPNSSRPANSERYLICQYKRENCDDVISYLTDVNKLLNERKMTKRDVLELVPITFLQAESEFFDYIVQTSNWIGERQAIHLKKLVYYIDHPELSDTRQNTLKKECLKYWDIPNEARVEPKRGEPKPKLKELFGEGCDIGFLHKSPNVAISYSDLVKSVGRKLDWYWAVIGSGKYEKTLTFYLGLGTTYVYRLEDESWVKLKDVKNFQLPAGTLVYGEIVQEIVNPSNKVSGQFRTSAFHIVDGLFLGKQDIRDMHITERARYCEMFAKSLSNSQMKYRTKKLYEFNELPKVLPSSLQRRKIKGKKEGEGFVFDLEPNKFFVPNGLVFFRGSHDRWICEISQSSNKKYYYNVDGKGSYWEENLLVSNKSMLIPEYKEICADFRTCFEKRIVWWVDERNLSWLSDKDNYSD